MEDARQCTKDKYAMSAEAERLRNDMVHTLKNLDKGMKLAKDEANTLVNKVKVEGKNGQRMTTFL